MRAAGVLEKFLNSEINRRVALSGFFVGDIPHIAQAREHQTVFDARKLVVIPCQPSDRADGSGDEQKSKGVAQRSHAPGQYFRKSRGYNHAGKIVIGQRWMTAV